MAKRLKRKKSNTNEVLDVIRLHKELDKHLIKEAIKEHVEEGKKESDKKTNTLINLVLGLTILILAIVFFKFGINLLSEIAKLEYSPENMFILVKIASIVLVAFIVIKLFFLFIDLAFAHFDKLFIKKK